MFASRPLFCALALAALVGALVRVLAAEPPPFQAALQAADGHMKAERWPEALQAVRQAMRADTNRFEAPALAAIVLYRAGQTNEAALFLARARELAPPAKAASLDGIAQLLRQPLPPRVPAPTPVPPTGAPAASTPNPGKQRQINVLQLIIEEADKAPSEADRRRLLDEFMAKSEPFVRAHRDERNIWLLRAVAALELSRPLPGREAAQELERLGAAESTDPKLAKVLALLDRKGWTGAQPPPTPPTRNAPYTNSLAMRFVTVSGTEVLFSVWETRVRDFEAFVAATGYDATAGMWSLGADGGKQRGHTWKNPGFAQSPDHPVCGVSWFDATKFAEWLTQEERAAGRLTSSQHYRLPTDREWSAAVGLASENGETPKDRSGKVPDVFPWGRGFPPPGSAGNYAGAEAADADWPPNASPIAGFRDGFARTAPVGSFPRNEQGLFDLGGNVWEWCEDWSDGEQKARVLRGGSWGNLVRDGLLSSGRYFLSAGFRGFSFGFRLVLVGVSVR